MTSYHIQYQANNTFKVNQKWLCTVTLYTHLLLFFWLFFCSLLWNYCSNPRSPYSLGHWSRTGQDQLFAIVCQWFLSGEVFLAAVAHRSTDISQVQMYSLMSPLIPGQKSASRARLKHPSIPRWEVWILSFIEVRKLTGMTTRSPRNISPSWTVSSSRKWWYANIHGLTCCLSLGHPSIIVALSCWRVVSFSVSIWICFSRSFVTGSDWIRLMCSASSDASEVFGR